MAGTLAEFMCARTLPLRDTITNSAKVFCLRLYTIFIKIIIISDSRLAVSHSKYTHFDRIVYYDCLSIESVCIGVHGEQKDRIYLWFVPVFLFLPSLILASAQNDLKVVQ